MIKRSSKTTVSASPSYSDFFEIHGIREIWPPKQPSTPLADTSAASAVYFLGSVVPEDSLPDVF